MTQLEQEEVSGQNAGKMDMKLEVVVIPGYLYTVRQQDDFGGSGLGTSLYVVVSDIVAAREQLVARGVNVSEVFHPGAPGAHFQPDGSSARLAGPAPEQTSYGSYATFRDPDGNSWLLQEVTTWLPGRVEDAAFTSVNALGTALRRAATAHGEHERRIGQRDENWPRLVRRLHDGRADGREVVRMKVVHKTGDWK